MADTKKEQERAALHSTIWRIANDLRGSVDGWDFKQYVLGILFYRFISDNLSSYVNEKQKEAGEHNFNYAALSDRQAERTTEEHFSRLVPHKEIEEKEYNISVGTYVAPKDEREEVDITELNARIETIVARQNELRTQIDAIVADLEGNAA